MELAGSFTRAQRVLDEVELGFSGAEIRIAVEDFIVDGSDVKTDGVIENLRQLKMLREVIPVRKKYYTKEFPSGPWSRALYAMRTGKPFKEEEFRDDHKDS